MRHFSKRAQSLTGLMRRLHGLFSDATGKKLKRQFESEIMNLCKCSKKKKTIEITSALYRV